MENTNHSELEIIDDLLGKAETKLNIASVKLRALNTPRANEMREALDKVRATLREIKPVET